MTRLTLMTCGVAVLCVSAGATVLVPVDLAGLSRDARVIARGRVAATVPTWTGDWRSIETLVTLDAETYLKGAAGVTLQFRVPGGQMGRYRRWFVGAPEFSVGQRVIVFLGDRGSDVPYVLGLSQGVFRLAPGSDGWVVTPPPILPTSALPQAIVRGDPARRAMRLDDFERHVRVLAGNVR
jgi:hypothetical protein